ncbi:MAG: hypothetical protein ACRD1N_03060, partial [Terriglobia bacterium]
GARGTRAGEGLFSSFGVSQGVMSGCIFPVFVLTPSVQQAAAVLEMSGTNETPSSLAIGDW